jgi:hypothetical protein
MKLNMNHLKRPYEWSTLHSCKDAMLLKKTEKPGETDELVEEALGNINFKRERA